MPLTYACVKNDNGWRSGMVCAGSNGGTWYECQCCPYGYHIDLDFVRYCDSLNNINSTGYDQATCAGGTVRRRQDRRRQRQSMEVLLGLVPDDMVANIPPPVSDDNINKRRPIQMPTVSELSVQSSTSVDDIRNSLNDVVQEFELTLQRTKGKRDLEQRNLPDVTAVTVPANNNHIDENHVANDSLLLETGCVADGTTGTHAAPQQQQQIIQSQPDERDFDAISIESATNLSPGALQNIRTQMALSLERTRHLEEMVKSIPALRDELDELKRENTQLVIQCSYWEKAAYRSPEPEPSPRPPSRPPSPQLDAYMAHRDAAVLATVLTRNVAVGSQVPLQRTTCTQTPLPPPSPPEPPTSTDQRATQQYSSKYTQASPPLPPATFAQSTQSAPPAPKITVAVSEDTIMEKECARCIELEQQIQEQQLQLGVVTAFIVPTTQAAPVHTVSIAIGTEIPTKPTPRTQASQATAITIDKSQQATEQKTVTAHKMSQCEYVSSASKHTQHKPAAQSKAIQTQIQAQPPINTLPELTVILTSQPAPSRIPVPRTPPTPPAPPSPTATRTFRRQDTYTKLPTDDKSVMGLSGLDLGCESSTAPKAPRSLSSTTIIEQEHTSLSSSINLHEQAFVEELIVPTSNAAATKSDLQLEKSAETITAKYDVASSSSTPSYLPPALATFEKFEQKFILPKVIIASSKHAAPATTQQSPTETQLEPVSSEVPVLSTTQQPLPSGSPSREMQAAVKVLNDSLERGNSVAPGAPVAPHLRTAHQLIEREWFRVSSLVGADPLHVEAYLDHLDAVGSRVLQYIVNMVDSSGNTAMHYSVSHGNFDVVSILLDSKVCDVNRQNLAGYTSLMLVSPAEVRSSTHAGVVRRLFALGDVNVRARSHGQTALMLAVSHGRSDMVAMLLSAGADINIQDDDGSTALMCAAEHGHVDIVGQFLAQPDCDSRVTDVDGCTALRIAMDAGHRHIGVLLYAHERRLVHGPASAPATPPRRRSNSATSTSNVVDQVREESVPRL